MVVRVDVRIEPFLPAADFQLADNSRFRQHLQISIHCRQTDSRHDFLDPLIQFIGGEMLTTVLQLLKNDLPLACHSHVHESPLLVMIINCN